MRKRMIAALMLIFALMMLAPVGGSRSAVQAETVQAASGSWQAKGGKWYYWEGPRYATGWREIDGEWYYFNASGVMQTGWVKVSGSWYYMNSSGAMQTGWVKVSGSWYYMASSGVMQTGWVKVSGSWYYMNSSGVMQTGWVKVGSSWYYMASSGVMQTGWVKEGRTWYYMASSGKMQTGWVKVGSDWYYLTSSGRMVTGWLNLSPSTMDLVWDEEAHDYVETRIYASKDWYYFNGSGKMQTGWVTISGAKYYFSDAGKMAHDWQKISGAWYYFWDPQLGSLVEYDVDNNPTEYFITDKDLGTLQGEIQSAQSLTNKMNAMKSSYPEGMTYTNANSYEWEMGSRTEGYTTGYGCAGFAALMSDAAFGRVPVRYLANGEWSYDSLRVGDILRINNNTHSVIILEKYADRVVVAEANFNSSVHWGRVFTKANVQNLTNYVYTRYPENYN